MGLALCNSYPTGIWTAIMFYSPETCGGDGGDFEMMGWWRVDPGSCVLVYANDLEDVNQFWYYYAEADDGALWAGPFGANVSFKAFGGDQWSRRRPPTFTSDTESLILVTTTTTH